MEYKWWRPTLDTIVKENIKGIIIIKTKILAFGRENVPVADVQNFRMSDFYLEFEEKILSLLILKFF